MSYPVNHKTVFVLDHGPVFSQPCDSIDFDQIMKSRQASAPQTPGGSLIPLAAVTKNMWTCATEGVLEYCRIVWDLFPSEEKLVQFVVAGGNAQAVTSLSSWDKKDQSTASISAGLAGVGRPEEQPPPSRRGGNTADGHSTEGILAGLRKALESLCQVTEAQQRSSAKAKASNGSAPPSSLVNRGRIVCITSVPDDRRLHALLVGCNEELAAANETAANTDGLAPISLLSLDVVHCHQGDFDGHPVATITPTTAPQRPFGPEFEYQVFSVDAGRGLARKLLSMVLNHYQLASTTGGRAP